ncbi:MAG: glycosyltransferase [Chloroflexota bacterium]|nr:glycosyltransferase [Chloroflexota bacterium]
MSGRLVPALFWASIGSLVWVYLGYPLVALVYGRLRAVRVRRAPAAAASVTVGLAVHNAADQIEARLGDILAQQVDGELEVIVASDGSTDETDQIVERMSRGEPRIRLLRLARVGQSAAQAAVFERAQGELVVLTDAETRFAPGCVAALVAPFADERVGCTTGRLDWRHEHDTDTAHHEGLYWRYEQAVRAWESRAGWLSAATGALMAVRRSIYRPAPAHASLDQMLPLYARQRGWLVLSVPAARATDRGPSTMSEQFHSRVRIATQGIEANLRMAVHIAPWQRPGTALAIWSHKLLRWATPFFAGTAGLTAVQLTLRGRQGYVVPAALIVLLLALALVGYVAQHLGRPLRAFSFPVTVLVVNAAFAVGWLNVLLRRRIGSWEPARRA